MTGPLDGVRVIEAGPLLPVPATGANLVALGAEVIRIDPPSGNPAERVYGGWLAELYAHGKQARRLDSTTPTGRSELDGLVDTADVVIVGYRPRAVSRMGLDCAQVHARRRQIVHCSIVGYPSAGPRSDEPGHDLSFLAETGALSSAATPSAEGTPPRRPAPPVADLAAASVATQAILAGLIGRQRNSKGQCFEIAISEVMLGWMAPRLGHLVDAAFTPALDPANDIYTCRDGLSITVAAIEARFWSGLVDLVDLHTDLPPGCREWDQPTRIAARQELGGLLARAFACRDRHDWLANAQAVPLHAVHDPREVVAERGHDPAMWRRLATPLADCVVGGTW